MPTNLAKAGNKVTLNFVTSFPIINPTVTFANIASNRVSYNNPTDGRTWEASYDVVSTDNDGVVTFTISGTDYAGTNRNFNFTTPSPGVTIDTTSPILNNETPIGITNDTTPSYVFTSSEDGTLSSTLAFTSPNPALVTTGSNTITFDTLSDATYTGKTITVTDAAGNASNLTIPQFVIDTIPPTAAITYSQAGPYKENATTTITATFTESLITTPKINISGVSSISEDMSGSGTTWTYGYTAPSGNGTETISLSAGTDAAGNEATTITSNNNTFTVDNTAPTATITYSPAGPYKENDSVTITATFTESLTTTPKIAISGVSSINATGMSGSGITWTYDYTAPAGDGTETITLSAGTDAAGNEVVADPTNKTFTVDNTAPTFSSVSATGGPYGENDTVIINVNFSEAVQISGTPSLTLSNGKIVNYSSGSGSTTLKFNYTVGAAGTENTTNLQVTSMSGTIKDSAGNTFSGTVSSNHLNIVIDNIKPTNNGFTMDQTLLNIGNSNISPTTAQVGIVFSEKVQSGWYNFITTDDGEMGGTFGAWQSTNNNDGTQTWHATFTAGNSAEGPYKFFLSKDDYQDLAGNTGNGNASGPQYIITDPNS